MRSHVHLTLLFFAVLALPGEMALAADPSLRSDAQEKEKSADDDPVDDTLDGVDGIAACQAFVEKNARDQQTWEKTQPPTPYKYPERETFLDAPWMPFFRSTANAGALLAATLIPNLHAVVRDANPAAGFSWPWSIQVGPAFWCSRKKRNLRRHPLSTRPHFGRAWFLR